MQTPDGSSSGASLAEVSPARPARAVLSSDAQSGDGLLAAGPGEGRGDQQLPRLLVRIREHLGQQLQRYGRDAQLGDTYGELGLPEVAAPIDAERHRDDRHAGARGIDGIVLEVRAAFEIDRFRGDLVFEYRALVACEFV